MLIITMVFEHDYNKFPELSNAQLEVLQFTSPHKQITEDFTATVIRVHDGDTVTLRTNFRDFSFPLRLLEINAPELNEPRGKEVQQWLQSKLLGKEVHIGIDSNNRVGKYGRLLGTITANGMDVGDEMLRIGLVEEFGKKNEGSIPPFSKLMKEAEIGESI